MYKYQVLNGTHIYVQSGLAFLTPKKTDEGTPAFYYTFFCWLLATQIAQGLALVLLVREAAKKQQPSINRYGAWVMDHGSLILSYSYGAFLPGRWFSQRPMFFFFFMARLVFFASEF